MVNLIKMDTRRLFHSNVFLISLSVVALFNIVLNIAITIAGNFFMGGKGYPQNFDICNAINKSVLYFIVHRSDVYFNGQLFLR